VNYILNYVSFGFHVKANVFHVYSLLITEYSYLGLTIGELIMLKFTIVYTGTKLVRALTVISSEIGLMPKLENEFCTGRCLEA